MYVFLYRTIIIDINFTVIEKWNETKVSIACNLNNKTQIKIICKDNKNNEMFKKSIILNWHMM